MDSIQQLTPALPAQGRDVKVAPRVVAPKPIAPTTPAVPMTPAAPTPAQAAKDALIAATEGATIVNPVQPNQVTPYLNQQQNEMQKQLEKNPLFEEQQAKKEAEITLEELKQQQNKPTLPKLEDAYSQAKAEYGLPTLEKDLNELKTLEENTMARLRQRTLNEKNQRVGLGVIAGRVGAIEQQERDELDFIQRQINTKTNQLQAANTAIDTMMKFKQTDYQNASEAFNTEFNKNMKMYEIANDNYKDIQDMNMKIKMQEQDAAKATMQIYANMITSGSMKYSDLDAATQQQIAKLEMQSGLGVGFLKGLDLPLNSKIKEVGTRVDQSGNKYADVIIMKPDGGYEVKSTFLGKEYIAPKSSGGGGSSSSSASAAAKQQTDAMKSFWDDVDDAKKALRDDASWGEVWNSVKAKYPGISPSDIDMALGVPKDWIKQGKPGWEWWNQYGKQG